jgi:hypothetical protein
MEGIPGMTAARVAAQRPSEHEPAQAALILVKPPLAARARAGHLYMRRAGRYRGVMTSSAHPAASRRRALA